MYGEYIHVNCFAFHIRGTAYLPTVRYCVRGNPPRHHPTSSLGRGPDRDISRASIRYNNQYSTWFDIHIDNDLNILYG